MGTYPTQKDFEYALTVDGVFYGYAKAKEGGNIETDGGSTHPGGGMRGAQRTGGPKELTNITLKYDSEPQYWQKLPLLKECAGDPERVATVVVIPVDGQGRPRSTMDSLSWTGLVENVNYPEQDKSSNDQADIEIELGVHYV